MQLRPKLRLEIKALIATSRERAIRSVDFERVLLYWHIGQKIFEEEQGGKERAGYGEALIKSLAEALEPSYGSSFSFRQLNLFRQFYRSFPIMNALRSQLSWTHYRLLMRIDHRSQQIPAIPAYRAPTDRRSKKRDRKTGCGKCITAY